MTWQDQRHVNTLYEVRCKDCNEVFLTSNRREARVHRSDHISRHAYDAQRHRTMLYARSTGRPIV